MISNLITRIGKNWKSTLAGLAAASFTVVLNGRSSHTFVAALLTALVGALAKD